MQIQISVLSLIYQNRNTMTSKIISEQHTAKRIVFTTRTPIVAAMEFTYPGTKNNSMKTIGYYDTQIVMTKKYETIKEVRLKPFFYA